jgi:cytochrome c-type biogenesis protein
MRLSAAFSRRCEKVIGIRRVGPLPQAQDAGSQKARQPEPHVSIAEISLLSALLAGALSFLSPCVLPLVPPYLCYMAGISVEQFRGGGGAAVIESRSGTRRAVLKSALFFTLGFATVFVALGAGASTIGVLLRQHLDLLSKLGGLIIIVMGLNFLGVFRIGILAREARFQGGGQPATLSGAYVMGLAFAFGWTPCIGPILAAILSIAAAESTVAKGAGLLAVYSAGLGIPFLVAAFMVEQFSALFMRMRGHLVNVERAMGVLMIVTGIGFLTGAVSTFSIWLLETFPVLQRFG